MLLKEKKTSKSLKGEVMLKEKKTSKRFKGAVNLFKPFRAQHEASTCSSDDDDDEGDNHNTAATTSSAAATVVESSDTKDQNLINDFDSDSECGNNWSLVFTAKTERAPGPAVEAGALALLTPPYRRSHDRHNSQKTKEDADDRRGNNKLDNNIYTSQIPHHQQQTQQSNRNSNKNDDSSSPEVCTGQRTVDPAVNRSVKRKLPETTNADDHSTLVRTTKTATSKEKVIEAFVASAEALPTVKNSSSHPAGADSGTDTRTDRGTDHRADSGADNREDSGADNTTGSGITSAISTFRELGVCEELCLTCEALGWTTPTEIQAATIPVALQGSDIIGLAETGSGKTGAFAIPVIQKLLDQHQQQPFHHNKQQQQQQQQQQQYYPSQQSYKTGSGVFALVLAPTRELTVQIADHFKALGASISLKVCTLVGGLDIFQQALELAKKPHVIAGTPGRVVDHLENTKGFGLGVLRFLIMDEADRLLSMDFEDSLNSILQVLPKNRNTYLFSATMTSRVSKLQRACLVKPIKIEVCKKFDTAKNLVQSMKLIQHREKWTYLVGLLAYFRSYSTMVFVNTCLDANRVTVCIRKLGFESICLHGKLTQHQRLGALNCFKSGRKKILVATEVGSRGLDIPHVEVVINFDVPLYAKDYVHRVGRTARAGRSGRAITLVTQYDIEAYQRIEHSLGKRLDVFEGLSEEAWKSKSEDVAVARRLAEHEIKEQSDNDKKKKKRR